MKNLSCVLLVVALCLVSSACAPPRENGMPNANGNTSNSNDNMSTNDNLNDDTNGPPDDSDSSTEDDMTSEDDDGPAESIACVVGAAATEECMLDSCTTSIADDVPRFFKTYFRCVTITIEEGEVVIESDNVPPHKSYYYNYDTPLNESHPNFEEFDTSNDRSPNPNQIGGNAFALRIPMEPVAKDLTIDESLVDAVAFTSDDEFSMGIVGVGLDSVSLFNSLAAPGDDINDEFFTFDNYEAHAEPTGDYHYHTTTPGPLEVLVAQGILSEGDTTPGSAAIEIYGVMCDGTVVMGCTELDGSSPSDSDFDSQNGHVHDLVDADGTTQLADRYHVHVCPEVYTAHRFNPEIQFYEDCSVSGGGEANGGGEMGPPPRGP